MDARYATFIWISFGLGFAVMLWNWLAPRRARNDLRRRLSEAANEDVEADA